jgi:hypothetical protein
MAGLEDGGVALRPAFPERPGWPRFRGYFRFDLK